MAHRGDVPVKGRGAVSNPSGRYDLRREAEDDGWHRPAGDGEEDDGLPPLATTLSVDTARSILTRNDSPDIPFEVSINPYRGCEHGCIYCFARPTHAFLGLSPGLDFETRLFAKPDAPALLERALRRPGYVPRPIALGTNTDPYQPVERRTGLTRALLEVLDAFNHPVGLVTKSALVLRDRDLLAGMAARRLVQVAVSLTTLDPDLARRLEPRAPTPARRLATMRALTEAGVPVAVLTSPVIPGLTDAELERLLAAAAEAGATRAAYVLLRLPHEIKDLFAEWLRAHAPERAERVLALVRDTHGGALYRAAFGSRMRGTGAYAALLADRFRLAARRHGLDGRDWTLDASRFAPPPLPERQLSLF